MYPKTFRERLAQARKDAGYTQLQIQDILGIKRSTLASWEAGYSEPNVDNIAILADFYEVSADWLLGTKGKNK